LALVVLLAWYAQFAIFTTLVSVADSDVVQLWFRRRLPQYACKFIEMVLMMTADHGPAVAGAHNTIVTARAGRDLVSSLASGLLTIGPRFGGAVDGAAKVFATGYDMGMSPFEFVEDMRKKKELISGIGHRVKSIHNPDARVEILKRFALQHFPAHSVLDYALEVEQITTKKKPNLILNVDGCIGKLHHFSIVVTWFQNANASISFKAAASLICCGTAEHSPRRRLRTTSRTASSTASSCSAGRSGSSGTTSTRRACRRASTATRRTTSST
jgi:hypothetical protein